MMTHAVMSCSILLRSCCSCTPVAGFENWIDSASIRAVVFGRIQVQRYFIGLYFDIRALIILRDHLVLRLFAGMLRHLGRLRVIHGLCVNSWRQYQPPDC